MTDAEIDSELETFKPLYYDELTGEQKLRYETLNAFRMKRVRLADGIEAVMPLKREATAYRNRKNTGDSVASAPTPTASADSLFDVA